MVSYSFNPLSQNPNSYDNEINDFENITGKEEKENQRLLLNHGQ